MKVISVVGHKKSGKTTLVLQLVKALSGIGPVGTVKHMVYHRFNPKDTDTGKHFDAGAEVVTAITENELVVVKHRPSTEVTSLERSLDALADSGMDFAVVEGDKESSHPKILLGEYTSAQLTNIVARLPANADWDIDELVKLTCAQPEWVTLDHLIKKVRQNPAIRKSGAIGIFTGIVREYTGKTQTQMLEFEKYEGVADESIRRICTELKQKEGILDVLIHHKTGRIDPGGDILYIVVASSHRTQLFPVLSDAIERVKSEVPIWKKELTFNGEFWVHDHE